MSAPRAIPDFTAVSRFSFEAALGRVPVEGGPRSRRVVSAAGGAPPLSEGERLVVALIERQPFRLALRHAGLSRRAAKQWLEHVASRCMALHASHLAPVWVPDLVHVSARLFALKREQRQALAAHARDETWMWTHLWIDRRSQLIAAWTIGSSTSAWPADERAPAGTHGTSAGIGKKTREHGLVISLLATAWNFCTIGVVGAAPAPRAGWTEGPWPVEKLAAIICRH